MCGLAGFLDSAQKYDRHALERMASAMGTAIAHRGPDDGQTWCDPDSGIALAFRRLSIQDLTAAGRQPMQSGSGRYRIVFNGEIYNAPDLRSELTAAGARFEGHSDTEILVELVDQRGFRSAAPLLRGMFAIACWDRRDRVLHLARDPLGKKPLYYGQVGTCFGFASQPKALLAHPEFNPVIDRDALCSYFRFGYIPAPHSIYRGIQKLRAGEMLDFRNGRIVRQERIWTPADCIPPAAGGRGRIDDVAATEKLEQILGDAVERRLVSDVPLGAFLSGGIDSSLIAALMRQRGSGQVGTYSIGFEEKAYDESARAKAIANHLRLDHTTFQVKPADLVDTIPALPEFYDEPFADPSQVPTIVLSRLTRKHITVALSGDGGDELFAGYRRYALLEQITSAANLLPASLRLPAAQLLRGIPEPFWRPLDAIMPSRFGRSPLASRVKRVADMLGADGIESTYRDLVGQWRGPESLVVGGHEPVDPVWTGELRTQTSDQLRLLQLIDLATYLPDDILVKVDRASMAYGLEVRAPLLDQEVVAFALGLPVDQLVRDGTTKWLLRQVLHRHVPNKLVDQPKMGFGFPLAEWLRGPLRGWAEDLLEPKAMQVAGILEPALVAEKWKAHLRGEDWSYRLWCVLMFEAWRRNWMA